MDIRISENLKKFRKEHDNTQEDLAAHLNISSQAVSKWERGEGFPDITLLPFIAAYYNKSVDELLGCSEIERTKKIDEYRNQYEKNENVGKTQDNIDLMKTALKEFPNDLTLMSDLCHAHFAVYKSFRQSTIREILSAFISQHGKVFQETAKKKRAEPPDRRYHTSRSGG